MVDAAGHEVLHLVLRGDGREGPGVARSEERAVGEGPEGQERLHRGIDGDRARRQPSLARGGGGDGDAARHSLRKPKRLVGDEEERPLFLDRTAERGSELIATEWRLRRSVEEVPGVERIVAKELESAAV